MNRGSTFLDVGGRVSCRVSSTECVEGRIVSVDAMFLFLAVERRLVRAPGAHEWTPAFVPRSPGALWDVAVNLRDTVPLPLGAPPAPVC